MRTQTHDAATRHEQRRPTVAATAIRLGLAAAALVGFSLLFEWEKPQILVPCLWVGAILLWAWEVRARGNGPLIGLRMRPASVYLLAALLAVFAVCWLPFYDNWRWAFTGDSIGFYGVGYHLHERGLRQNPLSVRGIDNFYTYLWELSYNGWMLLFGPSFFAHRLGLFLMGCFALASTFALYGALLGSWWGAAIVVATATNYVWLWMSYVSYLRMDGILFFNVMLLWAVLVWRHPERLGLYLACGLTAGLSIFYTPAAWGAVAAAGAFVFGLALYQRRTIALVVLVTSALLAALPALLEIPWFVGMFHEQSIGRANEARPTAEYVLRIFREVLVAPYDSPIVRLGGQGAFFPAPLNLTYFFGCGLALLATVPPLRRRLRIPASAAPLLLLLAANALLFALTNKNYAHFSHKRTYVLIPLYAYFAILPAIVVFAWVQARRWWRHAVAATVVAGLGLYTAGNMKLIIDPAPYTYGANVFDGLIELRQRYPQTPVVLVTSRSALLREALRPDEVFELAYRLSDTVRLDDRFAPSTVEAVCGERGLLCYEPAVDRERMDPLLREFGARLQPFPLLNAFEVVCLRCEGGKNRPSL